MPMGGNTSGAQCGDVKYWPTSSAPAGWLKANGAAVSRTTYAALFAVIGTTYGAGDGSTTFNLPDLRGEFIRGYDDGRGVDSSRAFGSSQLDQFQRHKLAASGDSSFVLTHNGNEGLAANGATATGAGRVNVSNGSWVSLNDFIPVESGGNGTPRYGSETRSRNVALLACVKY